MLSSVELCAGGGGQALGLEQAGFEHAAVVEIDSAACETLRANRPYWNVIEGDIHGFSGTEFRGIDLIAGGVPCPPFSIAGKQLGAADERDLFPEALRVISEARPRALMLENVRGLASVRFEPYRTAILKKLADLGYQAEWRLIYSSDYGVPQLRPRFILIAGKPEVFSRFAWPGPDASKVVVADVLYPLLRKSGWLGAEAWRDQAQRIAPTIVGGSKRHGGPDLGPTRARVAWAEMRVDGRGIADEPPGPDTPEDATLKLTTEMVAAIQGFPPDWTFAGRKTAKYRQIGNAFPPPVAFAIGTALFGALSGIAKLPTKILNFERQMAA